MQDRRESYGRREADNWRLWLEQIERNAKWLKWLAITILLLQGADLSDLVGML